VTRKLRYWDGKDWTELGDEFAPPGAKQTGPTMLEVFLFAAIMAAIAWWLN